MYNFYQRLSRSTLANTDALSHVLLSYLAGVDSGKAPAPKLSTKPARSKDRPATDEDE